MENKKNPFYPQTKLNPDYNMNIMSPTETKYKSMSSKRTYEQSSSQKFSNSGNQYYQKKYQNEKIENNFVNKDWNQINTMPFQPNQPQSNNSFNINRSFNHKNPLENFERINYENNNFIQKKGKKNPLNFNFPNIRPDRLNTQNFFDQKRSKSNREKIRNRSRKIFEKSREKVFTNPSNTFFSPSPAPFLQPHIQPQPSNIVIPPHQNPHLFNPINNDIGDQYYFDPKDYEFFPESLKNSKNQFENIEWKEVSKEILDSSNKKIKEDPNKKFESSFKIQPLQNSQNSHNQDPINFNLPKAKILESQILSISSLPQENEKPKEPSQRKIVNFEDPKYDQKGDNRNWNNWVIQSFIPKNLEPNIHKSVSFLGYSQTYTQTLKNIPPGSKFTDRDFPPQFSSIWGFGENRYFRKEDMKKLVWKRPEIIFNSNNYQIFDSTIEPNDIKQGILGDCYLLGSIAAISKFQNRVKKIFLSREKESKGCYCVGFYLNGMFQEIIIDDFFPVRPPKMKPAFNSSPKKEIWVMMLEKAWAKYHGGYLNIDAGLVKEALHDLTGAPSETFFIKNQNLEENWHILYKANLKKFILAGGTKDLNSDGTDRANKSIGLSGCHAYAIIDVFELERTRSGVKMVKNYKKKNFNSKNSIKLLKIKNPWGRGEWKGTWNDNYSLWTPELRENLGMQKSENDGVFCMELEDFLKYFNDYQICYYKDSFYHFSQSFVSSPSEAKLIEFNLKKGGQCYFMLHQISQRCFRASDQYVYSRVTLLVFRINSKKEPEYIGIVSRSEKDIWFEAKNCKPGKYIAYVLTPWRRNVNSFTISTYAEEKPNFTETNFSNLPINFLEKVIKQKAIQNQTGFVNFSRNGYPNIGYKFEHCDDGIGYFYFYNNSKDVLCSITVKLEKIKKCEILPPYSNKNPQITIAPFETKIILFKILNERAALSFGMVASFKKQGNKLIDLVKRKGARQPILYKNRDVGIYLLSCGYENGILFFFENMSREFELESECEFELVNCSIEGRVGNVLRIEMRPRDSHLVNVVVEDGGKYFEAFMVRNDYNIKRCHR